MNDPRLQAEGVQKCRLEVHPPFPFCHSRASAEGRISLRLKRESSLYILDPPQPPWMPARACPRLRSGAGMTMLSLRLKAKGFHHPRKRRYLMKRLWYLHVIEFRHVRAEKLFPNLHRQVSEIALDVFARLRPCRVPMRIVVGPHTIILAPPLEVMAGHSVPEERRVDLVPEILAWILADGRRIHATESSVIVIPLLQHEGQPADFVFHGDEFQAGVAVQYAVEDHFKKRVGYVPELQVNAAAVTFDALSAVLVHLVAMAGQDVQVNRHIELLRRGPELIVVFRVKGQARMRHLPNDGASEAGFFAAFQLFYRCIDVVHGDGGDADQAFGSRLTIVDQPVVVGGKASGLQFRIIKMEKVQEIRRVQHFRTEAIGLHLCDSAGGMCPAGMGLEAFRDV